jgi:RNA recognition motif-containing protein
MKIYVGNLALDTRTSQLRAMFEPHGTVASARLVVDKITGKPKGFGFVDMDEAPAQAAIAALHGTNGNGGDKPLKVSPAKPKERGAN